MTKQKTQKIKPYNHGTMTEAAFFGWIRSHLRRLSLKWRPRTEYLKSVRREYSGTDKRTKWEYECQECKSWVKQKDYEIDHIVPCGSLKTWNDLPGFCKRMLTEIDGYRGLCKDCHQSKTNKERANNE